MHYYIFDIETDGLVSTKIHCVSVFEFNDGKTDSYSITDYASMRYFFLNAKILIGHNIIRFDIPEVERVLGIKVTARLIDTMGVSWYLYPERFLNKKYHGLEEWGEDFGIPKPKITDWQNLTKAEYVYRCEEDVKITTWLWNKELDYLKRLYEQWGVDKILNYITFKLECAREQEQVRWKLDIAKAEATLQKLERDKEPKFEALKAAMPARAVYSKRKRPKMMYKQDGTLSAKGEVWMKLCEEMGIPPDMTEEVKVKVSEEEPNPRSHDQIKEWLFSLGWVPQTFKYSKDKITHQVTNKVPQVNVGEGKVCPSVELLFEKEPALVNLEGLGIINHRITVIEGFLRNVSEDGYLKAEVMGFTNTMRFMHTGIVNVPTVNKPYGVDIRGCLTVPDTEEWLLCGSDMSSLEDNTKQHYIYYYDPEYVKEMRVPGFDPHLDIALQGSMLTEEEINFYKWMEGKVDISQVSQRYLDMSEEDRKKEHKKINAKRKDSKVVNFSATYGVGAPKMSLTTGWPQSKSKMLLTVYWKRNWAIKEIAKACTVKVIDNQMWLWNPTSQMYYSLRFEKDKFSTLNQGTGVYCFDTYVKHVRHRGIKLCGQFHDEVCFPLLKKDKELVKEKLNESIKAVNDELKLNVPLAVSMEFGLNYAETH